ncbi:PIN domain-containing protein [filamentous cyanobacterium LEGE 11480]|uniref:PIN domain-containing protein n=1 Tax=Romeriopsis navalis LEGE 11480 TaxID=2777977 RepID=A0A928VNQ5_9CYAN|nr:PIN domain-containing protein [Romeriopsis navalis]MBE9030972.1 PIN domain-containing protein [Romeriopsis navalis LEGE 11480]
MSVSLESSLCFVDSNIWLYALIRSQDERKHQVANQLLRSVRVAMSAQVVNEVSLNLMRKAKFSENQVEQFIRGCYQSHLVMDLNQAVLLRAADLRRGSYLFSFWDSLVVAAALETGADVLISEDMQQGLVVEGVLTIHNPF